ncbi:MAG: 30S ribosomal protein S3ae [archaeon]
MAKKKAKRKVNKWKDKNWYTIEAPETFERKEIGDTPAESEEELVGRTIEASLRDLTGKRSHNNIRVKFKVKKVEGGKGKTEIESFNLTRGYIRKNIRKGRSVIQTIQDIKTNGNTLHTTAYAFTVGKLHSSKEKKIRKTMDEELQRQGKENDFESLIQKMIFGKTATNLFRKAKEIAPVNRIEITKCEIERGE